LYIRKYLDPQIHPAFRAETQESELIKTAADLGKEIQRHENSKSARQ
jgi:hypothetical protein